MPGCGHSQDPFIFKHKHIILYWWDHPQGVHPKWHRKGMWVFTSISLVCDCVSTWWEGYFIHERTPALRDTRSHMRQMPEDPWKFTEIWRELTQVRFIAQSRNVSAVGQIQYLISSVQRRGNFTVTKKRLSKTFFSHCQNRKMGNVII